MIFLIFDQTPEGGKSCPTPTSHFSKLNSYKLDHIFFLSFSGSSLDLLREVSGRLFLTKPNRLQMDQYFLFFLLVVVHLMAVSHLQVVLSERKEKEFLLSTAVFFFLFNFF
mmetsp:Transcript_141126/g.351978  ORF Transcript_141126/g.351978 Transcript_141126/m.351978 type:complete len:111 (+) Transcript_141126:437-769(+)